MQDLENSSSAVDQNGTNVAIISYITMIGWIVALLLHANSKSRLGAFHLKQSLGIMLMALATYIINYPLSQIHYIGWMSNLVLNIALVGFWILGLISAIQGKERPVPILGELFQKWFAQLA